MLKAGWGVTYEQVLGFNVLSTFSYVDGLFRAGWCRIWETWERPLYRIGK
jgi:hypothetical protein